MRTTDDLQTSELAAPGPIGLAARAILGAFSVYWLAALLTKWNVFLVHDPIESERYYTAATIWLLPHVFTLTFGRQWGQWPRIVFVVGGASIGLVAFLVTGEVWDPVLAGWVYGADLLVMMALGVSFPVAIVTRSPGCELAALPRLLRKTRGEQYRQPGCAMGLDYLDRWEASRRG